MPSQGPWIAFLAMCFAVVGLAGLFASYAAPLPYERAIVRLAALPASQATTQDTQARTAILTEAKQEADAVAGRLRLLVAVLTVMAGTFGCGIAALMRRQVLPRAGGGIP